MAAVHSQISVISEFRFRLKNQNSGDYKNKIKTYYVKNNNGKYLSEDGKTRYRKLCGRTAYTYLRSDEGKHKRFAKISDADDFDEVFLEFDADSIPTFRVDERREQYV